MIILLIVIVVLLILILSQSQKKTEAVEQLSKELHVQKYGPAKQIADIAPDIVLLAQRGKTIEAIKLYRERTGCSLREAKERIEAVPAPTDNSPSEIG